MASITRPALLCCALASVPAAALAAPSITLSARYVQMLPGAQAAFSAVVTGEPSGAVTWQVNNINGGSAAAGTITPQGAFTAPANLPSPAAVTVTAVSVADPTLSATATITLLAYPATGTTYIVAKSGSDANPGTPQAPFATIQHAADIAQAGDTVLVHAGTYNALLAPKHGGDSTHGLLTISAYPGEAAVIDGTGLAIPQGQWGLITLQNTANIVIQGFTLQNYSTSSANNVPVGLYVLGAGDTIQLVNNHVTAIRTTAATTPARCNSNALGMAIYGNTAPAALSNIVVSGNELDHLVTGCSESMSLDGNVDGFVVASNVVHDNNNIGIDAIGFEGMSPNPAYDQARHGEIRGNTVRNITSYGNPDYGKQYASDGIYVDGGTQIVVEQNLVHNVDLGIELASEHANRTTSYVTVRNNVVYANNSNGISIGGYGSARGGSDHIAIVNNTLWNNDTKNTGSGEFQVQWHPTNNLFENNIVYAGAQALMLHNYTRNTAVPVTSDYNLWFSPHGSGSVWQWNGTAHTGLAAYRAASGQDSHGPGFTDPLFASLATPPVLIPSAQSPARGAGTNLGATLGAADFAGNPRVTNGTVDLGAYQVSH